MRTATIQFDEGSSRIRATVAPELAIHDGDQCVIQVDRVLEFGRVQRLEDEEATSLPGKGHASVVRCATLQDQAKARENLVMNKMAKETVAARVAKLGLKIKLIRVRYSFDRASLLILFVAEEHPDYRDLIRELSSELNTRIDIRQIGVRDEAALLGGAGPCGRALCCCTWLRQFESINVRMAKTQGISLNPSAISGMCGRLKCCLGYEYEQYRTMDRQVPREGCTVECASGKGRVCARDILRQRVKVVLSDERVVDCEVADLRRVWQEHREEREEPADENPDPKWSEP
jgi:cell fate regulator YaaT (PSP1 superfamily)